MLTERQMNIAQAVNVLTDDDFTHHGLPKVDALSDALKGLGFDVITADERDTEWAEILADAARAQNPEAAAAITAEDMAEPAPPTDLITVLITESATSPIEVSVNGAKFTLYRNTKHAVPAYVVAALQNSDIIFTEVSA